MRHPDWPVYEVVTVPATPEVALAVPSLRVPRHFFYYRADDVLTPAATRDRPHIRFGRSAAGKLFCLDATSGEVVELHVDPDGRILDAPLPGMDFVNSSLEQFNRSIEVLVALFPYDGGVADPDAEFDWTAAADRLAMALEAIDPRSSSE